MTVNEDLLDEAIRHAIRLERLKAGEVKKILAALNRDTYPRVLAEIAKLEALGVEEWGGTVRTGNLDYQKILKRIDKILHDGLRETARTLQIDLRELADVEVAWQAQVLRRALPPISISLESPSAAVLDAVVTRRPFQGRILRDWADSLETSTRAKVRKVIGQGIAEGQPIPDMVRTLKGTRAKKYTDGVLQQSRKEVEAVVRTATNHVTSGAKQATYEQNRDVISKVLWVSTLDSRTTQICASLDSQEFPIDSGPRPPAHFACLPGDSRVSARHGVSGASKRRFHGDLVVIRTSTGRVLTCTPNHPVLTRDGWVPAGCIHEGSNVVCDGVGQWGRPSDRYDEDVPPRIHDVAEPFLGAGEVGAVPVPVAPPDFHGDGAGSDVAIVRTDRDLRLRLQAAFAEHVRQAGLGGTDLRQGPVPGHRNAVGFLRRALATAARLMRCARQAGDFLRGRPGHAGGLLLASVPGLDPALAQEVRDAGRRAPERLRDSGDADAVAEHPEDFRGVQLDSARPGRTDLSPGVAQAPSDGLGADAELASQILAGATGPVFLDEVVRVEMKSSHVYVYNLETGSGFYVAEGVIVHNCRSTIAPVTKSFRELGIDLDELDDGTRASMNGQVPAKTTYGDWLKRQPVGIQDEVLGKQKAQWFRSGRLTIDKFTDSKQNVLTVQELRAKYDL